MAKFRAISLLCLALSLSSTEANALGHPVTCYILDAFLLLYCIIFTALYFRTKFSRQSDTKAPDEPVYQGLNPDQVTDDNYQTLELQGNPPTRRNRAQQEESQYEALRSPTSDEYQEFKKKGKTRKSKSKSKDSGAESQKDAGQAMAMAPVPPLPSRS